MAEIITKDCKEYHIWDKVNGVWNRLFFKTNTRSVEADDGKDLQTKVGALNGITSDLNCEDESVAISAKAVNDSLKSLGLKSSISLPFTVPEDGFIEMNLCPTGTDSYWYVRGSDGTRLICCANSLGNSLDHTNMCIAKKGVVFSQNNSNGVGTYSYLNFTPLRTLQ